MPNLTITYDETHRGIALWVQTRTDVPPWPILFDADQAHILLSGLHGAINDRDRLRGDLDEIRDADPDDFRG